MTDLSTYEAWFEGLKPELINNVYHIDIHNINVNQELKSELQKGKLLVLFKPEIKPAGGSVDSAMERWNCLFFVIEKILLKGDSNAAERKRVRNETLNTSRAIKKMMFDIASGTSGCHFLRTVEHMSFEHNFVGPVFVNMYGWSTEFSFLVPVF